MSHEVKEVPDMRAWHVSDRERGGDTRRCGCWVGAKMGRTGAEASDAALLGRPAGLRGEERNGPRGEEAGWLG